MGDVLLARWQFGITSVYHFLFVPLTLGLSVLVAIMETLYVRTGNELYKRMAKFWGKLFLLNFSLGVVTGLVQEFQFGMNWSEYSRFMGDIFGVPLALEAAVRDGRIRRGQKVLLEGVGGGFTWGAVLLEF